MRKVLCGLAVLWSANLYAMQYTYLDGWDFTLSLTNLRYKTTPFLFIISDLKNTNIQFVWNEGKEAKIHLNLDDGTYQYGFYDADKNLNESGSVKLLKPLRIKEVFTGSESWQALFEPKILGIYNIKLTAKGKVFLEKAVKIQSETNIILTNLLPDQNYQLILSGKQYQETVEFQTIPLNLALKKPVWGTFSRMPESKFIDDTSPALTRLNDGVIGWYSGMTMSDEIDRADQMAFINLEKRKDMRSFKVYWHASYCPVRFYFVYSTDGVAWFSLERSEKYYLSSIAKDSTPLFIDSFKTNINAQYIGVLVKKGETLKARRALRNYLGLMEIEAYE